MKNLNKFENLENMVKEINAYNYAFEYLEFFRMEEFNDIMSDVEPEDIANKIFFGDFNPLKEYFIFDGYGNLESRTEEEVQDELEQFEEEILEEYKNLVEAGEIEAVI